MTEARQEIEPAATPGSVGRAAATWIARVVATRAVFLWPVIAAIGLWVLGGVVHGGVEREVARLLERQLRALQDANAGAVEFWYARRLEAVGALAGSAAVRSAAAALPAAGPGPEAGAALADFRETLAPYVRAQGLQDVLVVNRDLRVVAAVDERVTGALLDHDEAAAAIRRALETGAPVAAPPHRSLLPFGDAVRQQAGLAVVLLVAPIRADDGTVVITVHRAQRLGGLLQMTRSGDAGLTFAVNERGLLLTPSRSDEQLKLLGLIPDAPEATAALTLEARDPGADLTSGARPAQRRAAQPLTRAAEGVAAKVDGVDVAGYRDVRGVRVVGAWTWLPEAGIGLVTEVDVADAYAPARLLRTIFRGLFTLLALAAVTIFAFTLLVRRTVRRAGQYTLLERLGQGAMGTVYRARHALLRRPTAVKVLEPGRLSREALQRFEREAQTTSQLTHPNTVTIYDYGRTADGGFYYAMELLEGITLEELVRQHGPQPAARVLHLLVQVSGALAEAHEAGLIHRDVKPANLMLTRGSGTHDMVKVLDFGLVTRGADDVKVTSTHQLVGTPLYMAPEALEGMARVGVRADVHAVGAVGYYLLTGTPPYGGVTVPEVIAAILRGDVQPPSARLGHPVPAGLEALILRCLERRPEDRPADGQELLAALEALRAEVGAWSAADARAWWAGRPADPAGDPAATPPTVVLRRPDEVPSGPDPRALTATSALPPPRRQPPADAR